MHEFIARVMVAWQGLISVVLANSIVALVIFFVGFIIGRVLGKIVEKILKEAELNWIVGKALKKKLPLAEGIAKAVSAAVYAVTIFLALRQLGLAKGVFVVVGAVASLVMIITVFLNVRDFFPNVRARRALLKQRRLGQKIRVHGIQGKIMHIGWMHTKVRAEEGDQYIIPNATVLSESKVFPKG